MPDCGNTGTPASFRPIIIWFFTYDLKPAQGSATYCAPAISLWDVAVTVDIASSNLTSVREIKPFDPQTSPFTSFSGNITGVPLNGRAFNGVGFDTTGTDQFVAARASAANLQLPASIVRSAETGPGGLDAAFGTNSFPAMATQVYVSNEHGMIAAGLILNHATDYLPKVDCEVVVFPSRGAGPSPSASEKLSKTLMVEVGERAKLPIIYLTGASVPSPFISWLLCSLYLLSSQQSSSFSIDRVVATSASGTNQEQ
jgi:hypothetical protein